VLFELARRFLQGDAVERTPTSIIWRSIEAVDANLCAQRWLLVVLSDGVLRIDMDGLAARAPQPESIIREGASSPVLLQPAWDWETFQEKDTAESMAVA